ncbi:MAG: 8-amino-3,8-dideoxy-alpha-D-manno-octulosonate transaminase [Phycisphaerae bacterium]|nr:8-amino-3,8-dideoxy-alpha-D-manno-octulosonate transaminase [Phycisphaerae bacterium]
MPQTTSKLAIDGGEPVIPVDRRPGKPVRWDDAEREQLARAIDQESLFYWNGPQTRLLIERFKQHYPFKYVYPCSSGTAAIHIAVAAAGIGLGDEVITTALSDMGTYVGVLYQQAVPIFADLEPGRLTLDPADVARHITPRTKAIIAVHLAGNPCDMAGLRALADKHDLILIEDCAQAWGAKSAGRPVGTIGELGCYSLNDFKHIGCGDGGIVATNDDRFGPLLQKFGDKAYDRLGATRNVDVLAPNYRISELQSAVAAVQMNRLVQITSRRHELGERLTAKIRELGIPGVPPHRVDPQDYCSYWFYMFCIDPKAFTCDRDRFADVLAAEGTGAWGGYASSPYYQRPIFAEQNIFAGGWPVKMLGLTDVDYTRVRLPVTEAIAANSIYIGIRQNMTDAFIDGVAEAIAKVADHLAK